jgi:polyisoprenoid-binding protein YceI
MTAPSSTTALPAGLTTGTWAIETSHSAATFTVRHAGIAKVRGAVAITEGTLTVGDDLASTSVTATLDPATIDTRDSGRDTHLRSGDFFEVETYPTWTFTSTALTADGDDVLVTGDLTIHGVTQQVALRTEFNGAATDPFGNERVGFTAATEISRKDFGLTWNAALETGGVLVSDNVKITLDIEFVKA